MTTAAPTQQQYASASLYVGDLHEDVTEAFLYEVFREVGPIVSIRVCRDSITRKSLGYAYVNFQNPEDAERALDTLNFTTIKGKPIRIMWSQRDPAIRKSGVGNIFIKNLDASIDNKALYDTFSTFGNILSCSVKEKVEKVPVKNEETGEMEERTVTKGYGFVHFETQQAADTAVAKMNGMLLNGKKVFVAPFQKKSERFKMGSGEKDFTNVFVKNLDTAVTTEQLIEMFSKFGKVQHAEVMADDTGASRGFGFVNFEDHEAASAAVDEMNEKDINGKKLFVGRHQPKQERVVELRDKFAQMRVAQQNKWEGQNLYVKNLDDNFDEERLKAEFSKYGEISSSKIMRDEKGQSKGFGFVCFATPEGATRALTDMNGKLVGTKPLYVALAQKKEVRQAQLEAAHRRGPHMAGPLGAPIVPGMPPAGPYGPAVFFPPHPGMPIGRAGPAGPFPPQMHMRPRWQGPAGAPGAARGPMGPGPMPMGPYLGGVAAPMGPGARGGRGGLGARGGRGGKMRYNQNVRNQRPMDEQAPQQPMQQVPVEQAPAAHHLTLANLANMPPEEQKRVLGEQLFPMIHAICHDEAGKVTGMLLELDVELLLELIENSATLEEKVNEAMEVLREHAAAQQQA